MLQKRTLYDIFKLRIILCFVVPIVLTAIIIFANHRLNIQQYHTMYNEFYSNYTDEVFLNMDEEINTVVKMDYWLKNDEIKPIFTNDANVSDADVSAAIQRMKSLRDDFGIIDSILIVNRKADFVVATNGKASTERYFNDILRYKEYDAAYFEDIRYPLGTIIKLPPTEVEGNDGGMRYVMPIVNLSTLSENPNCLLIYNISLDKIMNGHSMSKYTDHTSFWFVNKKDKKFYSAGENSIVFDDKIWEKIDFDAQMQYYKDANGERYCVFTKSVSPNLLDYAYLVFIPTKDVRRAVSGVTIKIVLISIAIYLLFVLVVMLLASDVGRVFAEMVKPLNFNEQVKMREIFKVTGKISEEFSKILEENTSMKSEIKNMMGDVKEKMITDVLNNRNRTVKMSLYKFDSFVPVVFRIIPEKDMKESIFLSIKEQLYSALRKYFDGMYEAYDITNLEEDVHFVLNVPEEHDASQIKNEINKLAEIVSRKEIDVSIEYHIGEVCHSFEKLRDEYLRLRNVMSEKSNIDTDKVGGKKYLYRISEHNSIINSILEGDSDKVIATIDRILITNVVNDVPANDMKALYQNIINAVITALKMKGRDVDQLIDSNDGAVYFNLEASGEAEISRFILDLINSADNAQTGRVEENAIEEVVKFVGENYDNYDLTLESVAKEFNFDSKSLSRKFKNYCHVTFHKYLTEIRIEEAKRLLITTDMSIEQIYIKVGYVSRTTFMRAFNSVEKVTPSEYRKKAKG